METALKTELDIHRARVRRGNLLLILAALALVSVGLWSITAGSTSIPLNDILAVLRARLFAPDQAGFCSAIYNTIIWDIRLPRVIMAGLTGAALAVAGAAYQGMFRNPLADPYLTGISQGAALGAVAGFLLPAAVPAALVPVLAFLGAILSVAAVYSVARTGRTLPVTTLILGGVAIGAFLASITSYLIIISDEKVHGIVFWLLGTFSLADWWRVAVMLPYILAGAAALLLMARPLNVMQLDEEQAEQLGINVERTKLIILAAATLTTAAAVCFCGAIGFVGIIIPHAVRMTCGPDYRLLLPMSLMGGAAFLILADTAARTIMAPTEVPVGIITAVIGAPFFLYLLNQKKKAVF
jgi:iron complex transport system permease protein